VENSHLNPKIVLRISFNGRSKTVKFTFMARLSSFLAFPERTECYEIDDSTNGCESNHDYMAFRPVWSSVNLRSDVR
jgi:hypothetical protein